MIDTKSNNIFIDPSSSEYYENRLFDQTNLVLNRDDTLAPFIRLQVSLKDQGVGLYTADCLPKLTGQGQTSDYFSLGVIKNYEQLSVRDDVRLRAFVVFEPPVVAPSLYRALPELTAAFERVFVHNTIGDGYSLIGIDPSKLRKLYWPQPYLGTVDKFWSKTDRMNRVVVINGNHKPQIFMGELYSKRIEAMVALANLGAVDLYGRGWERWWARNSLWTPYWLNRRKLMSIFRGECLSKHETLSHYRYCLCFENMEMKGYVTEKIFDCLYVGTIPLYWGASDIESLIPSEAYIDARKFSSWEDMWLEVNSMSAYKVNSMREAGRQFLNSNDFIKYYNSFQDIVLQG